MLPPQHTNFDIATNVPLILRVPGLTDRPSFRTRISTAFMELVDVFPTLSDFAGIQVPPEETPQFEDYLKQLQYVHYKECDNPAYRQFLL